MRTPIDAKREQHIAALAQMLKGACAGHEHSDVLSALMRAFRDIAIQSPCCHTSCIQQCLNVVATLALSQGDVSTAMPASSAIH